MHTFWTRLASFGHLGSPEQLNEKDISGSVLVLAGVECDTSYTLSNSPGCMEKLPSVSACGTVQMMPELFCFWQHTLYDTKTI